MDLCAKHKPVKLLEKSIKEILWGPKLDVKVLDFLPQAQPMKGKFNKLDLLKIERAFSVKGSVGGKDQDTNWGRKNTCEPHIQDNNSL